MAKQNIAPEVLESWKKSLRHGDVQEMVRVLGYSAPTLDRAIKQGYVSIPGLVSAITNFFTERLQKEAAGAQALTELNNEIK